MATGFNNTPPASEFRRHNSWGRTRQPKNLAGSNGTRSEDVGGGSVALDLTSLNDGTVADRQERGYVTENQRYLHLATDGSGQVTNLYAYSHAAQRWSEFKPGGSSVTCGTDSSVVVEIAGIDRVAFRGTSADADPVFLAGSTF